LLNDRSKYLMFAGMSIGGAFLSRQQMLLPLLAVTPPFLALVAWTRADAFPRITSQTLKNILRLHLPLMTGLVCVLGCFFLWLAAVGALHDWYLQTVIAPRDYWFPYHDVHGVLRVSVPDVLRILLKGPPLRYKHSLVYVAPWLESIFLLPPLLFLVRACAGLAQSIRPSDRDLIIVLISVVSLSGVAILVFPSPATFKYLIGILPAIGLYVYLFYLFFERYGLFGQVAVMATASLLFSFNISTYWSTINKWTSAYWQNWPERVQVSEPAVLRGTPITAEQADYYGRLDKTIQMYRSLRPMVRLVTTGGGALPLTFLESAVNFHPLSFGWPSVTWNHAMARGKGRSYAPVRPPPDTANTILYPSYYTWLRAFAAEQQPMLLTSGEDQILYGIRDYVRIEAYTFPEAPCWYQFSDKDEPTLWVPGGPSFEHINQKLLGRPAERLNFPIFANVNSNISELSVQKITGASPVSDAVLLIDESPSFGVILNDLSVVGDDSLHNISLYVRAGTSPLAQVVISFSGGKPRHYFAYFDPQTMTLLGTDGLAELTPVKDGWHKLRLSGRNNKSGNTILRVHVYPRHGRPQDTGSLYIADVRVDPP
jgi:hypothetical protein